MNQVLKPKSDFKKSIKCPVNGCDGLGNKNNKYKSHRTVYGCPNSKGNSILVDGKKKMNRNVTKIVTFENESDSNLTLKLKEMDIKLRETQARLRKFENDQMFNLESTEAQSLTIGNLKKSLEEANLR